MKTAILLTIGNNFIAKGIQFFEFIYEKFGKNTKSKKMYNHAVFCYVKNNNWWIQESLSDGASKPKLLIESKYWAKNNFVVKTLKASYSDEDLKRCIAWCESKGGTTKYDFLGIGAWIVKTFTNKWIGKTGEESEKRMYCSEFVEAACNILVPQSFESPWDDNPMNIYDNDKVLKFVDNEEFRKIVATIN